jgi:cyclopropane fatty-acyl-phospholipid synthase-like methyltransferase
MEDALSWTKEANIKRPFRTDFFHAIETLIKNTNAPKTRILELGSGAGFLAEYLLSRLPNLSYDLFDFSPAMHELSSQRLTRWRDLCRWLMGDFKQDGWSDHLKEYDIVVTVQAVHELRHKRYAAAFHKSVLKLLATNGTYLMCDHYVGDDGMRDQALYMTPEEHLESLNAAGFGLIAMILKKTGLILFRAKLDHS